MDSLLQTEKECYITGAAEHLHKHHIYQGAHRQASEKWGCWVWLRQDWHNGEMYGVHHDKRLDTALKQICQTAFERRYGHEKFMEIFGKNYL